MTEVILYDEKPTERKWRLETIYRKKENGNVTSWRIGYNAKHKKRLYVKRGQIGGKTVIDYPEVIPKVNRSYEEQALQEAKYKFIKKIRNGYCREKDPSIPIHKPQLAKKYIQDMEFKEEHFRAGIACQPKADGIRAIATLAGDTVKLTTRETKDHYFLKELREELRIFLMYLPRQAAIDGELYIHGVDLEELKTYVMRKLKKHKRNKDVCIYVFDIIIPGILEERINILLDAYQNFIEENPDMERIKILNHGYAFSKKQIKKYFRSFLNLGYEGMMMRKLCGGQNKLKTESEYTNYRNNNLVKYKEFDTSEGIIIGVRGGKNKDKDLGIFTIEMPNGATFDLKPGTDENRIKYLRNPKKYIGKTVTYKHFGNFEDDNAKPRFPTWVCFRDEGE